MLSDITIWCMTQTLLCALNNGLRLHGCSEVLLNVDMQEHVQTWYLHCSVLLRGVLFPDQHFGTTYFSHIHGSRNLRTKPVTLGSAVYMGEDVGGDWFPVSVLPACGVNAVWGRWEGGRDGGSLVAQCCSEVKWPGKVKPLPHAGQGDKGRTYIWHKRKEWGGKKKDK